MYLVADALDEVPRGAHRDTFLDLLTHIASLQFTRLHMLVTAREMTVTLGHMEASSHGQRHD